MNKPYREYVKSNIYKALHKFEGDNKRILKQWTPKNVNKLTIVLIAVEKYVGINHKKMLSTILTESDMDIYVIGGPNNNKSYDYGLVQQNSPHLKKRYTAAKRLLKKHNITYTNNIFDISVNVMSGALVLKDFKKQLRKRGVNEKYAHFVAYNCGPSGYFYPHLKQKRHKYLKRYKSFLVRL
jgi:aspartokinase